MLHQDLVGFPPWGCYNTFAVFYKALEASTCSKSWPELTWCSCHLSDLGLKQVRKPPNAVKNVHPNSSSCICFCQRQDLQACSSNSLGKDPARSVAGRMMESRVLNTWRVVLCAKMSHSEVHAAMQSHLANFQELHCSYLQWSLGSVLQHRFRHKDREFCFERDMLHGPAFPNGPVHLLQTSAG